MEPNRLRCDICVAMKIMPGQERDDPRKETGSVQQSKCHLKLSQGVALI